MSRQEDLEQAVRESFALIHAYEDILRTSDDPKEKDRCSRTIEEQRELIQDYQTEYQQLTGHPWADEPTQTTSPDQISAFPDRDTLPDPGPLPPGSRLPWGRNALFTGRVEAIKSLAQALFSSTPPPPPRAGEGLRVGVWGLGGVGKTQLAVEFVHRYGRFFRGVHWINAAQPGLIDAEIAQCGAAMALLGWPDKLPEQVARTLNEWQRTPPRLVVLDNLEDVSAARAWLPRLAGVRLLLTARRADWPADLNLAALPLDVFTEEESVAFLGQYRRGEPGCSPPPQGSHAGLPLLADRLGHLPLALELAGRYLARHPRLSVADYLQKLQNAFAHPSMQAWRADLGSPTGHNLDLASTFALSWAQVDDENAQRLFLLAGHCAPNQPIPFELLQQASDLDEEACDEALNLLVGLGLLRQDTPASGPLIHPLLAEYARTSPIPAPPPYAGEGSKVGDEVSSLAAALVTLTQEAGKSGLPSHFAPLRPHVEALLVRGVADEHAGMLWNNLGCHLHMIADYGAARAAFEQALEVDEHAYGSNHSNIARDVSNLGRVLHDLGNLLAARAAFEQALGIDERVYGPNHHNVAIRVNNLGGVLRDLGDLPGAAIDIDD